MKHGTLPLILSSLPEIEIDRARSIPPPRSCLKDTCADLGPGLQSSCNIYCCLINFRLDLCLMTI